MAYIEAASGCAGLRFQGIRCRISSALTADEDKRRRLSIGFNNFAHAVDHYVMLIFPTVVIGMMAVYGKTYAELIALGTASFFAFGLFSLPAGWLADRWSRRNMMAVFYIGCGVSLIGAALAPNLVVLAVALFALGMFAAIYHPVGTAIVVSEAVNRGRTLAFNGVCGNLGVAFAAGITAMLTAWVGWRGAFLIPAAICIATGIAYLMMVPDDRHKAASRSSVARGAARDVADGLGVRAVRPDRRHCGPRLQHGDDRAAEGDRRADHAAFRWWRSAAWRRWFSWPAPSRNSRSGVCWRNIRRIWFLRWLAFCSSSAWSGWFMRPATCCCWRWPLRWRSSTPR